MEMELSRRDFLKISLGLGFFIPLRPAVGLPVEGPGEEAIPTFCSLCPASCGVVGVLKGRKLIRIEGNPLSPTNRGAICARGIAAANQVYDPERLLYPLKRVGRRGEGKWRRISWDEAFWEISHRLKEGGMVLFDVGEREPLLGRFANAIGAGVIDRDELRERNLLEAHRIFWDDGIGRVDISRVRSLFLFGANPLEGGGRFPEVARRLMERRREIRVITFDPRSSFTVSRSDEWHPIRPGTDAALALAMAKVIVKRGLYEEEALGALGLSLEELRGLLEPFTPFWAQEITGIGAREIERLAVEFATRRPQALIPGGGVHQREKGVYTVLALLLLGALAGAMGKEGGYVRPTLSHCWVPEGPFRKEGAEVYRKGMDFLFVYRSDPVQINPGGMETEEHLKDEGKVPFLVVMDTRMTPTASLADLLLPAAHPLEEWGLALKETLDGEKFLALRQPVLHPIGEPALLRPRGLPRYWKRYPRRTAPLGEALPLSDLLIEVAQRIGGEVKEGFPFTETEEYIRRFVAEISGFPGRKAWEELRRKGILPLGEASPKRPERLRVPLKEVTEAAPWKEREKGIPLILFSTALSSDRITNAKWLVEISHSNPLWVHPSSASEMGIREGERVKVRSPHGEIVTRVSLTERISPGVLAIRKGIPGGRISQGKRFRSDDPDTGLLWWRWEGESPYPLLSPEPDPLGGGPALAGVRVRVEKMG